jgi:hypothetical protein
MVDCVVIESERNKADTALPILRFPQRIKLIIGDAVPILSASTVDSERVTARFLLGRHVRLVTIHCPFIPSAYLARIAVAVMIALKLSEFGKRLCLRTTRAYLGVIIHTS